MVSFISGCNITLMFTKNELFTNSYVYTLPPGYSMNTIHITKAYNITSLDRAYISDGTRLVFPPVNSKSPSTITLYIPDTTKESQLSFTIEKFGQIPDATYFYHEFYPISVTGDDGNKYNVIPSNQFN